MPEPFTRLARDRLQQLTATLSTLRERVRDAVASELGKAVGEALRDLLIAVLNRTPVRPAPATAPDLPSTHSPYPGRWDDDDDEPGWHDEPVRVPSRSVAMATTQPVDALRLGVGLTRWLLQRRVPILAGFGAGIAVALATLSSHPIVQSGLALIAVATELIAITETASPLP